MRTSKLASCYNVFNYSYETISIYSKGIGVRTRIHRGTHTHHTLTHSGNNNAIFLFSLIKQGNKAKRTNNIYTAKYLYLCVY